MRTLLSTVVVCSLALGGCSGSGGTPKSWDEVRALEGTAMRSDLAGGFFARPFPADAALEADGTVDISGLDWDDLPVLAPHLEFLDQVAGFSTIGGVFLPFDGPLDPATLPADGWASLSPAASAFLVNVDPDSDGYGSRVPVTFAFKAEAETLAAENLLVALPVMGIRLEPSTRYALVVTNGVRDAQGEALGMTQQMATVVWSWERETVDWTDAPDTLLRWVTASEALGAWLTDPSQQTAALSPPPIASVRAFTVFTTYDPTAGLRALSTEVQQHYGAVAPNGWTVTEVQGDFCVVEGTFPAPRWQTGDPPYDNAPARHGRIEFDGGRPVLVQQDDLRFVLTIPHDVMPAAGFPLLAFGHGMNGEYRQVVDRTEGSSTSIAAVSALRGVGVGGLDAVAHGPRSEGSGGMAALNFFNFFNPWSVADNVRQTVSDYLVFYRMASALTIDASECPGVDASAGPGGQITWDPDARFFMGHSLGSSIGSLVSAVDPTVQVSILSGAGGHAISFVLAQKSPLDIKATAELVFGFDTSEELDRHDPILTVFQMIFDEADGPNFAPLTTHQMDESWPPRHVLQLQGLGDTYTPELTAASIAAAFGLDLAEQSTTTADYAALAQTLEDRAAYGGGAVVSGAVARNRTLPGGAAATAVLRYYEVDGAPTVNPHYGTFRMDGVKFQYGCFLRTFLDDGVPTLLPPVESLTAACE